MQSNCFYEFGAFRFNPVKGILLRGLEPVHLPPRSSELLQFLIENRDRIVPRDEIMTKVWGITVTVGNSALDYQVSSLRESLGDDAENPQYIKTFRRRGIKFVGTVKIIVDDNKQSFYDKPHTSQSSVVEQHSERNQAGLSSDHESRYITFKALRVRLVPILSVSILAIVSIVLLIYARQSSQVVPQINVLAVTSTAKPKQEFTVQIEGSGFDPEIVQVVLVGPGCKRFGPCTVPNDVLLDYGQVLKNKIERVPLTLDRGEFKLYVQNGKEGPPSNPWTVRVPYQ
ncbi:MAG TPA: transcriptional regulator [Pyrinomonadaceae bacterium]|nr:transcriptional regulator [Pyrinomonadaceae bacterium]